MVRDNRNCNIISTDKPMLGSILLIYCKGGDILLNI